MVLVGCSYKASVDASCGCGNEPRPCKAGQAEAHDAISTALAQGMAAQATCPRAGSATDSTVPCPSCAFKQRLFQTCLSLPHPVAPSALALLSSNGS